MMHTKLALIAGMAFLFSSCEKEIEVELPYAEPQIVVEGKLEEGDFPQVIFTRSIAYYTNINEETLASMFVNNASASIRVGNDTIPLLKICLADIPDSLLDEVSQQLNLPPGFDKFCIYTSLDSRLKGISGKSYELIADVEGKKLTSLTTIPQAVPLDSLWFKGDNGGDTLGYIYAQLSDPAAPGNAYRWFAQRINRYLSGENAGEEKDLDFIAPFNSAFNDEFFNGKTFPISYNRGSRPGSEKRDDTDFERGYFRKGDTVVVKFTAIDDAVYQYYRSFYNSIGSSGSPFSTPANVKTNVKGGLGIWAGYGVSLDTLIIR
ncbi:MAG: DUF4249 domain-containing protein [Bacteroidota bacterium]